VSSSSEICPPSAAEAPAAVIVLAAGEGTRMKSSTPKVLHELGGRSLVAHALHAAAQVCPERIAVVVRHAREQVAAHITEIAPDAIIADQDELKGTGRATQCALAALGKVTGTVLVTYGDVPLLTGETLRGLLDVHQRGDGQRANAVTVLTAKVADPQGYGRILRSPATASGGDLVSGIVEHRDATAEQREITEINSGIYAFDAHALASGLQRITAGNAQGELYLTDVLALARADGGRVAAWQTDDHWQTEGVNDRCQLATLGAELNRRILPAPG
jgi:bifunctional UDP-N-acetylglucosamine pyrophosphorylase / glucosamine-1-phosphate N-acetyltransferase